MKRKSQETGEHLYARVRQKWKVIKKIVRLKGRKENEEKESKGEYEIKDDSLRMGREKKKTIDRRRVIENKRGKQERIKDYREGKSDWKWETERE